MAFTLSDYINQTVESSSDDLSPEIIQAMKESYESGALGTDLPGSLDDVGFIIRCHLIRWPDGGLLFRSTCWELQTCRQYIKANENAYRIENTDIGAFLDDGKNWQTAIDEVNSILKSEGLRELTPEQVRAIKEPAWRMASSKFATEAGDDTVVLVTPDYSPNSAFAQDEVPTRVEIGKGFPGATNAELGSMSAGERLETVVSASREFIGSNYVWDSQSGSVLFSPELASQGVVLDGDGGVFTPLSSIYPDPALVPPAPDGAGFVADEARGTVGEGLQLLQDAVASLGRSSEAASAAMRAIGAASVALGAAGAAAIVYDVASSTPGVGSTRPVTLRLRREQWRISPRVSAWGSMAPNRARLRAQPSALRSVPRGPPRAHCSGLSQAGCSGPPPARRRRTP